MGLMVVATSLRSSVDKMSRLVTELHMTPVTQEMVGNCSGIGRIKRFLGDCELGLAGMVLPGERKTSAFPSKHLT